MLRQVLSGNQHADGNAAKGRFAAARMLAFSMLLIANVVGCQSLVNRKSDIVHVVAEVDAAKKSHAYKHGVKALQNGNYVKARQHFAKVVLEYPGSGAAFNNLGLACYELRQLPDAVRNFEAAIELLPNEPKSLNNLGLALEAGGKVFDALEYYQAASVLQPDNPIYLGNLVRAKLRLGESGLEVTTLLEDLAFIENRPEWLAWADEQLAIFNNAALDRGPAPNLNINTSASGEANQEEFPNALRPLEIVPAEAHMSDPLLLPNPRTQSGQP